MKSPHKPKHYRPDIDGLRALAIIPVLLFHAGIAGFSGGFVGVDIFFVISGFLITSIIIRELKNDTFSLVTFWERRIRRIAPAAVLVTLATLAAGYFIILYPVDYIDLSQSALAQALFLANIFFFRKDDYFAGASEEMPLLHTWSLSLEEQFYIGFPILLITLYTFFRRSLLPIIVLIGIASLAYSGWLLANASAGFSVPGLPAGLWGSASNAEAAFYLLPARAFELIIGAILALTSFSIKDLITANILSTAGLFLICYSIVSFSEATPFPGLAALLPTLGTAFIIVSNTNQSTFVGHLLSFPLLVGIGLISYSLYLWHWPILVLLKQYHQRLELTQTETLLAIVSSFILAYLTYKFIETPFRTKQLLPKRIPMIGAGVAALLLIVMIGGYITTNNGLPKRAPVAAQALAAATIDFGPRRDECFVNSFTTSNEPCYLGTQDKETVDFVLWGDSHAAALLPMIDEEARKRGLSGASFISAGCTPIKDYAIADRTKKCHDVTELAHAFILKNNVPQVLFVARWSAVLDHTSLSGEPITDTFTTAFTKMNTSLTNSGATLYITKQVPKQPRLRIRDNFYAIARTGSANAIQPTNITEYDVVHGPTNTLLESIAQQPSVYLIDPTITLCAGSTCHLIIGDTFLYQDADHLNKTGADFIAPVFAGFFDSLQH